MSILVVGGDSVDAIKQRARAGGHVCVEQWSGRETRDLCISIDDHDLLPATGSVDHIG